MALSKVGGGSDESLKFPSLPRGLSGLGLGLEGEKEMLNLRGEYEREEQVRRGRVRKEEVSLVDLVKQSAVIAIVAAELILFSHWRGGGGFFKLQRNGKGLVVLSFLSYPLGFESFIEKFEKNQFFTNV